MIKINNLATNQIHNFIVKLRILIQNDCALYSQIYQMHLYLFSLEFDSLKHCLIKRGIQNIPLQNFQKD